MCYAGIVGCVVRQRTVLNGTTFRWALSKPALHCAPALCARCAVPIQGVLVWWDKFEEEVEVGGSTLGSCDRTAGSSEMPLKAALLMHLGTINLEIRGGTTEAKSEMAIFGLYGR